MNRKLAFLDLLCYGAIPFLIWKYGREPLGDYWAILLSTAPAFIYTVYRFVKERQFNVLGLFIISSLLISTTVNLLSSSAERMLWNQVFLGFGFASVYLFSMLIKKPLALYFAVDFAYLQGYPRNDSISLFKVKEIFMGFQYITLLFALRNVFQNLLKMWLLTRYGADGYGQMIIYMTITGWVFSGLIMAGFYLNSVKINQFLKTNMEESKRVESNK
ncbi:VC0807 family protein [Oceanobacillus massiliensis]|uniref:VC0807 family protein n=1 Tax=Oceanobacillus massiliensis TaxID=1465765 RepID=UPI0030181DB1